VAAARPTWQPSWEFELHFSTVGARLKREYNLSKAELSRGAVLKNWKRRSAACAPRTPSSWNNVKFKKSLGILSEVPPRVMPESNR
jgi:hypothetical protein